MLSNHQYNGIKIARLMWSWLWL